MAKSPTTTLRVDDDDGADGLFGVEVTSDCINCETGGKTEDDVGADAASLNIPPPLTGVLQ